MLIKEVQFGTTKLADVAPGSVFSVNSVVYMKTDSNQKSNYPTAVSLLDGKLHEFANIEVFVHANAILTFGT